MPHWGSRRSVRKLWNPYNQSGAVTPGERPGGRQGATPTPPCCAARRTAARRERGRSLGAAGLMMHGCMLFVCATTWRVVYSSAMSVKATARSVRRASNWPAPGSLIRPDLARLASSSISTVAGTSASTAAAGLRVPRERSAGLAPPASLRSCSSLSAGIVPCPRLYLLSVALGMSRAAHMSFTCMPVAAMSRSISVVAMHLDYADWASDRSRFNQSWIRGCI